MFGFHLKYGTFYLGHIDKSSPQLAWCGVVWAPSTCCLGKASGSIFTHFRLDPLSPSFSIWFLISTTFLGKNSFNFAFFFSYFTDNSMSFLFRVLFVFASRCFYCKYICNQVFNGCQYLKNRYLQVTNVRKIDIYRLPINAKQKFMGFQYLQNRYLSIATFKSVVRSASLVFTHSSSHPLCIQIADFSNQIKTPPSSFSKTVLRSNRLRIS